MFAQKLAKSKKPVSDKTRSNIRSALHDFWVWLRKRRLIRPDQMPEFPETNPELYLYGLNLVKDHAILVNDMVKCAKRIAEGKRLGRPPVSPMTIEKANRLRAGGFSYRKIGKKLGISEGMVRKGLKRF